MNVRYFFDHNRKQVIAVNDSGGKRMVHSYVLVPLDLVKDEKEDEEREKESKE